MDNLQPLLQPLRILIADDHALIRELLTSFLDTVEGMVVVGEASNGQHAVDLCQRLAPDLVLMDLEMPGMNGITATSTITSATPFIRVVVLTASFSPEQRLAAFQAGASAFLLKSELIDTLIQTIYQVVDVPVRE